MTYQLHKGDCLGVMRGMADNSVDSVVTDPPYGISFMNHHWDYAIPTVDVWAECRRVLKPGGYLLSFASPRTQHRIAVAIEDAGFDIRDSIAWMYAQGMPKSGNLKPAHEPIIVARKRAKKVTPLNIDVCRVGRPAGRHPANLIHDGSDTIVSLFPNDNPGCKPHRVKSSAESVERLQEKGWGFAGSDKIAGYDDGDDLSAARFFFCAKASRKDRSEGNSHSTVKPTDLMCYLCRLVTPTGGVVLDPFMGSGSTGKAAMLEGFRFVGIERDEAYLAIAKARIDSAAGSDLV